MILKAADTRERNCVIKKFPENQNNFLFNYSRKVGLNKNRETFDRFIERKKKEDSITDKLLLV